VKWFQNLKTTKKLMCGVGCMALVMGLIGYVGLKNLANLSNRINHLYKHQIVGLDYLSKARVQHLKIGRAVRNAIAHEDDPGDNRYVRDLANNVEHFHHTFEMLKTLGATTERQQVLAGLEKDYAELKSIADHLASNSAAQRNEERGALLTTLRDQEGRFDAAMETLAEDKRVQAQMVVQEAAAAYDRSKAMLWLFTFSGVLMGLALGYYIAKLISKPLKEALALVRGVAEKDLTGRISMERKDIVGQIVTALNQSLSALSSAFVGIARKPRSCLR